MWRYQVGYNSCVFYFFTAPDYRLFELFRDHFASIDTQSLRLWDWPDTSRPHTFLVRELLQEHLLTECLGHDYYRELCELIIKFLVGQVCNIMHTTIFMKNFVILLWQSLTSTRIILCTSYNHYFINVHCTDYISGEWSKIPTSPTWTTSSETAWRFHHEGTGSLSLCSFPRILPLHSEACLVGR